MIGKILAGMAVAGFTGVLGVGLIMSGDVPTGVDGQAAVSCVTDGISQDSSTIVGYGVPLPGRYVITQRFGQMSPVTHTPHRGFDMAVPDGVPVLSASAGIVSSVVDQGRVGLGRSVIVTGVDGLAYVYGHMSGFTNTSVGEQVVAGQQIGLVGHTGIATGPHLHFEIRRDGTPIDPVAQMAQVGIDLVSEADRTIHAGASCHPRN